MFEHYLLMDIWIQVQKLVLLIPTDNPLFLKFKMLYDPFSFDTKIKLEVFLKYATARYCRLYLPSWNLEAHVIFFTSLGCQNANYSFCENKIQRNIQQMTIYLGHGFLENFSCLREATPRFCCFENSLGCHSKRWLQFRLLKCFDVLFFFFFLQIIIHMFRRSVPRV